MHTLRHLLMAVRHSGSLGFVPSFVPLGYMHVFPGSLLSLSKEGEKHHHNFGQKESG